MSDESYVTRNECEDYRKDFSDKLNDHGYRLVALETCVKQTNSILKLIFGAVTSGMISIIIILLTRGI